MYGGDDGARTRDLCRDRVARLTDSKSSQDGKGRKRTFRSGWNARMFSDCSFVRSIVTSAHQQQKSPSEEQEVVHADPIALDGLPPQSARIPYPGEGIRHALA